MRALADSRSHLHILATLFVKAVLLTALVGCGDTMKPLPVVDEQRKPSVAVNALPSKSPKHSVEADKFADSLGLEFVLIPAGEFTMGSNANSVDEVGRRFAAVNEHDISDEVPDHRVVLTKPFYLSKHEVTIDQFKAFCDATGYEPQIASDEENTSEGMDENGFVEKSNRWLPWNPGWDVTGRHPAVFLCQLDCVHFCQWMSQREKKHYRLPTEAEWEYACRGGTDSDYSFGDGPKALEGRANFADVAFDEEIDRRRGKVHEPKSYDAKGETIDRERKTMKDGFAFTAPVGSFPANPFGLHDMHGNVWEWCSDGKSAYSPSATQNPRIDGTDMYVFRGGGFASPEVELRSRHRGARFAGYRNLCSGFRVVVEYGVVTRWQKQ